MISRVIVLFPLPDAPVITTTSPARIVRFRFLSRAPAAS